ncbi:hypothetical protein [Chryseobacterium contaminans]|uniref:hypothetical protein n=1 Tax=Chryseobacterium contaminans TaxID=1423959 RepID=UPI0030172706
MNKSKVNSIFQFVRFNELDRVESEITIFNVNEFINDFGENLPHEAIAFKAIEINYNNQNRNRS